MQVLAFVFVGLIVFWLGANLIDDPTHFLDLFLVGLTIGMVYALIALGYSLVYGILELINFAHGDVFMLGGDDDRDAGDARFGLGGDVRASSLVLDLPMLADRVVVLRRCSTPRSSASPTGRCATRRGSRR